MPHIIIHARESVLQTYDVLSRHIDLEYAIEEIVSEVFNNVLGGEKYISGENVKIDGVFVSNTMPVEIHLTVLAWYSERRLQKQHLLQAALKNRVEQTLWEYTVDLHLIIVDEPS